MLHMVEFSHQAATCAAGNEEYSELAENYLLNLHSVAAGLEAKILGGWAHAPGHRFWYVVEAPNAHVASRIFQESKVYHWNEVQVHPVISHDEAKKMYMDKNM